MTTGPLDRSLTEEFRRRLLEARQALVRTLIGTDAELGSLEPHQPGGPIEDASTASVAALLSGLEGRERRGLEEIEEALQRLEAGTFGLCQGCGRLLPLARLRAVPAARYCLRCQASEEGR